MPSVELKLPHHRYLVRIEPGALASLGPWVRQITPHERAAGLLADAAVFETHGQTARQSLAASGFELAVHRIPGGESQKNLEAVRGLYDALVTAHIERNSPVIALGGGVVGDTVGFAASTYLRGVPLVQCPTTLLAMVDASVGGKVGVNLPQGKNLVGSFYQPQLVVADTNTLGTLPTRELRCGLAECVKHAVIRDADLFDWIERHVDAILAVQPTALTELVTQNVQIKASVVMADEKETGQRAHLNFGHTFAHAIEATAGYGSPNSYHHGEAVSLGMIAATRLAVDTGLCNPKTLENLTRLLDRIGLPTATGSLAPTSVLLETMRLDKKVTSGRLRLVLPQRLGAVSIVSDVSDRAIADAWDHLRVER